MLTLNGETSNHCRTCRQKTASSISSQIRRLPQKSVLSPTVCLDCIMNPPRSTVHIQGFVHEPPPPETARTLRSTSGDRMNLPRSKSESRGILTHQLRIVRCIPFFPGDSISGAEGRSSDPARNTVWGRLGGSRAIRVISMSGHTLHEHRIEGLERRDCCQGRRKTTDSRLGGKQNHISPKEC